MGACLPDDRGVGAGGFVCLCPPKSLEVGRDGQLHRGGGQASLEAELSALGFATGGGLFLPGGALAVSPGDGVCFGSEGGAMAALRGSLDNYAYLVKKFCSDDADCRDVARRGLNDVRASQPLPASVLLCRLYRRLGRSMLSKLRGQFALVVYDERLVRVLAARDPSGEVLLQHGRLPTGALVVASGVPLPSGAVVEEMAPGHFKYGWYSRPLKYANQLADVRKETGAAASAALKALSGLKRNKPRAPKAAKPVARARPVMDTVVEETSSSKAESPVQEPAPAELPVQGARFPPLSLATGGVPEHVMAALSGPLGSVDGNKLLSNMLDTSAYPLVITDASEPDCPIVYANPIFELSTGYSQDEVLGRNCRFLQAPHGQPRVPNYTSMSLRRSINSGAGRSVRLLNYHRDGTPMWNDLSVIPLRNSAGEITHFMGMQTFRPVGVESALPGTPACSTPRLVNKTLAKVAFTRSSSCNGLSQLGSLGASKAQSFGDLLSLGAATPGLAC